MPNGNQPTDSDADDCAEALDEAWQAVDDNLQTLWQMAQSPGQVQKITDCWNALSAAHMKLTVDRLKAAALNYSSLTTKLKKTTKAISDSLDQMKLVPQVLGLFADATTMATNAVKFVDSASHAKSSG
jgi:hypothetical protein